MDNRIAVISPKNFPTALIGDARAIPFRPSEKQVEAAEKRLSIYLEKHYPKLAAKWSTYYRQYTGLKVGEIDKIRAGFMCREQPNWKTEWVFVFDGGDCYFDFSYDPHRNEIIEFMVHGHA